MDDIVREGALQASGMVAFKDEVSSQELEQIRAYVIHRANQDKQAASPANKNAVAAHERGLSQ